MGKAFHYNNCFVDILANAFCPPLFSSLPFLLSSFKMTGRQSFFIRKRAKRRPYSSGYAWKEEQRLDYLILNSLQVHIQQDIIVLCPLKVYQLEIF